MYTHIIICLANEPEQAQCRNVLCYLAVNCMLCVEILVFLIITIH